MPQKVSFYASLREGYKKFSRFICKIIYSYCYSDNTAFVKHLPVKWKGKNKHSNCYQGAGILNNKKKLWRKPNLKSGMVICIQIRCTSRKNSRIIIK